MRTFSWLSPIFFALAFLFAKTSGATGMRKCSVQLEQQTGTTQSSQVAHLAEGEALVLKGSCVDYRSAYPQSQTVIHGPDALSVQRRRCNHLVPSRQGDPNDRVLEPLFEPVPGTFVKLDEGPAEAQKVGTYRLRETLAPGGYVLTWAGTSVATFQVGPESAVPRCSPELDVAVSDSRLYYPIAPPAETPRAPPQRADWDDRDGWSWELAAGPWLSFVSRPEGQGRGLDTTLGGTLSFGVHYGSFERRSRASEKGDLFQSSEPIRWCVPIFLCGGVGLLFASAPMLIGNEFGLDARVAAGPELARVTARPIIRYSSGIFRTASLVSLFVPEVGVEWRRDRGTGVALAWSLYPVDIRLPGGLAVGIDALRFGVIFGAEKRAIAELGPELTLRFAP